jgi:hypothetical protein
MTKEESEKALSIAKHNNKKSEKHSKHKISGIFFMDDLTWTVWIDNVPYSSVGQKEEFSLDEVSEEKVTLTMNDGTTSEIFVNADSEEPVPLSQPAESRK